MAFTIFLTELVSKYGFRLIRATKIVKKFATFCKDKAKIRAFQVNVLIVSLVSLLSMILFLKFT